MAQFLCQRIHNGASELPDLTHSLLCTVVLTAGACATITRHKTYTIAGKAWEEAKNILHPGMLVARSHMC